jgi:hypothetical protein
MPCSRRRFAAGAAAGLLALSGCVAASPAVEVAESDPAFDSFSVAQSVSWGAHAVAVAVTLAPDATTDRRVRRLVAVRDGSAVWTGSLEPGETTATAFLPVGASVWLLAADADGAVVADARVTVDAATAP